MNTQIICAKTLVYKKVVKNKIILFVRGNQDFGCKLTLCKAYWILTVSDCVLTKALP